MREIIHFVHGNGFPSSSYKQLLQRLSASYDCCYLDRVGHNPRFPVTPNWHYLIDEVIASIQSQATRPVIALGHSMGGVLSLLAAVKKPELFKAVVLLDSPLFGRMRGAMIRLARTVGIIDKITPAGQTKMRRKHWRTREEIVTYLRKRRLFQNFDERCLDDYIEYGMERDAFGYFLRFDPTIEYEIYRTIPDGCHEYEGKLKIPAALIYADKSHLVQKREIIHMEKKYGIISFKTKGSHMFPLEYPEESASLILDVLNLLHTTIRLA